MGKLIGYTIVNDVIIKRFPFKETEVTTQVEIDSKKPKLESIHKLHIKNKKIDEENKYRDKKKSKYEILFTVINMPNENLQP